MCRVMLLYPVKITYELTWNVIKLCYMNYDSGPQQTIHHPSGAFSARCALATGFMLENWAKRAMAATMSVLLSITMTALYQDHSAHP